MQKEQVLYKLIEHDQPNSSIIFCNTRGEVRIVAGFLARQGLPVAMISSDLVQKKREQVMAKFRAGTIRHLVATDVAARGIDIENLSHVFIFSTPSSPEIYIHRAGRTGRIGKSGEVISLVSAADLMSFNRLVNRFRLQVIERDVPSEEDIKQRKTERILKRLGDEANEISEKEFFDLEDVADAVAAHPDHRRLIAYLMRRDFGGPVDVEELESAKSGRAEPPQTEANEVAKKPSGARKRRGRRRRSGAKRES